jgi:hypothetical protein
VREGWTGSARRLDWECTKVGLVVVGDSNQLLALMDRDPKQDGSRAKPQGSGPRLLSMEAIVMEGGWFVSWQSALIARLRQHQSARGRDYTAARGQPDD